jgi:hypothetical protein
MAARSIDSPTNPVSTELSGTEYGGLMKDGLRITKGEIDCALQELLERGVVRPTGEYRNGRMVYECTPDAELSDEARAYAAYLNSLREDAQVN